MKDLVLTQNITMLLEILNKVFNSNDSILLEMNIKALLAQNGIHFTPAWYCTEHFKFLYILHTFFDVSIYENKVILGMQLNTDAIHELIEYSKHCTQLGNEKLIRYLIVNLYKKEIEWEVIDLLDKAIEINCTKMERHKFLNILKEIYK